MKQNLFIVLMLVAGFLLIYPLSVLAAGEAEGKTVVETPKEKRGLFLNPHPLMSRGRNRILRVCGHKINNRLLL